MSSVTKEKKSSIVSEFGGNAKNTGSIKRLLIYLSKHNLQGYRALIEKLGLRK